jgi:hypothetical protein
VSSWRVRDEEPAGDDEKVWLTAPDGQDWLFKPITEHKRLGFIQGEDWSEKVSSEIGALLHVPCAKVELAVRRGQHGSISLDLKPPLWQLQPGSVLLAETAQDYIPRDQTRRGHSLANIQRALEGYGPPPGATVPNGFEGFDVFAGFLILDAWIANRDRHDENWAVLLPPGDSPPGRLAGSYDHATSLGFNLQDADRDRRLLGGTVRTWAMRGDAYRFEWPEGRKQNVPTLVEFAAMALSMRPPAVRSHWASRLQAVGDQTIPNLVARVPGMSQLACRFVVELTSINRERLLDAFA